MNWKNHYRKALTFSYDDGNEQDRKLLEILNRYGMKATFNVNTGLNHDCGTWVYRNVLEVHRLNLAECSELYAGHEMAVHGVYHYNLTELTPEECTAELSGIPAGCFCFFRRCHAKGKLGIGISFPQGDLRQLLQNPPFSGVVLLHQLHHQHPFLPAGTAYRKPHCRSRLTLAVAAVEMYQTAHFVCTAQSGSSTSRLVP